MNSSTSQQPEKATNSSLLTKVNSVLAQPLSKYSLVYLAAGAMARVSSALITSPLDVLKARRQFGRRSAEIRQFSDTRALVTYMFKEEGVGSFYRGLPVRLLYIVPSATISFLFYEQFRHVLHSRPANTTTSSLSAIVPLLGAGVMRVIGTTCRTPFDVVRQRMQTMHMTNNVVYKSTWEALCGVVRKEGFRALFSGVGITVARDIPFSVTYFLSYEAFRTIQQSYHGGSEENDKLGMGNHMIAGATAAATAVAVTNPLDLVKTRLQTQGALEKARYSSIPDCFKRIMMEEGIRGFYKGFVPRLLYLCPSAALTFSLYEHFKKVFANLWHLDPSQIKKFKETSYT